MDFFSMQPSAAQSAQRFMFQNVAYRPTVYKTGLGSHALLTASKQASQQTAQSSKQLSFSMEILLEMNEIVSLALSFLTTSYQFFFLFLHTICLLDTTIIFSTAIHSCECRYPANYGFCRRWTTHIFLWWGCT